MQAFKCDICGSYFDELDGEINLKRGALTYQLCQSCNEKIDNVLTNRKRKKDRKYTKEFRDNARKRMKNNWKTGKIKCWKKIKPHTAEDDAYMEKAREELET